MFTKAAGARQLRRSSTPKAPISIRGRIATLVFPEGTTAMLVVNSGADSYAFSTVGVPALAKQALPALP